MITTIRRGFKKNGTNIILWIMLISMGWFWIPGILKRGPRDGSYIASVDGYKISLDAFNRRVRDESEILSSIRRRFGSSKETDELLKSFGIELNPKVTALNGLIKDQLMDKIVDNLKIDLDSSYVVEQISNPNFLVREFPQLISPYIMDAEGNFNMQAFIASLQRSGALGNFERLAEAKLRRMVVTDIVSSTVYVPEFEVKSSYISTLPKKFSILKFPLEKYLSELKKENVPDEELRAFLTKIGKKKFSIPEKRSGIMWAFNIDDYDINVSDKAISKYYESYKATKFSDQPAMVKIRKISFKDENKAKEIREQLTEDPSKFEKLMKEFNGETIGFFKRGDKDPELEKVSFRLKEPNDVSDVVKVKDLFEIIQLVDRKAKTYKSLDSVKGDIIRVLKERKFKKNFIRDMQNILEEASNTDEAFDKFVLEKKGTESKIAPVEKGDRLFRLEDIGEMTFYMDNGRGMVAKLTQIDKSYLPEFQKIKDKVFDEYCMEEAKNRLHKALYDAKGENKSFEELKIAYGVSLEKTGFITERKDLPVLNLEKVGAVIAHETGSEGYLIRLDEISEFKTDDFETKKNDIKYNLWLEKRSRVLEGFVASLYRNAKIAISDKSVFDTKES